MLCAPKTAAKGKTQLQENTTSKTDVKGTVVCVCTITRTECHIKRYNFLDIIEVMEHC